ncbi:MAG: CHASE domain-containing protein, partial [Aquabacterium sp.]|nr:CHASE domain-containing protein [Aquabacterium sp.]
MGKAPFLRRRPGGALVPWCQGLLVRWLPAGVLLVGAAISLWSALWLHLRTDAEATAEFHRIVQRDTHEISERFRKPVHALSGARGAYAAQPEVRRRSFQRFVGSLNLEADYPGVRGFGFIQRVARADLAAFVAAERADGAPTFTLRQIAPSDEAERFVIKYIEPGAANQGAVGLDVGSEPVRRQGVLLALESGEATTTGMVTLVQDRQQRPGVLLYLPVYADPPEGAVPGTRGPLKGLLYAPIVIGELLADLNMVDDGHVHLTLFDTASGTPAGPTMYESSTAAANAGQGGRPHQARFEVMRTIDVPGRLLTVHVRSTPAFEAVYAGTGAWLLGLGGLFASALLAALMRQQTTGRDEAERLARAMTADLERLALVARRTSNAVVITDAQRRVVWVNDGFERITGYSVAEAIGKKPGTLLQFEGTDKVTVAALRQALASGESFRGELFNRGKHGRNYWVDIDIQPLLDAGGVLTGFMSIQSDITPSKMAEAMLARERQSLQNIVEGTQVGTWEWNVETGQTLFNERWAQIVGHKLAELQPCSMQTWIDLVHPEDLKRSSQALERHFAGLSESYECEARMRHRDGHWVWVLDRGKLFSRSAEGRPLWMAGTHMDITARKLSEAALRANQSLLNQTGRIGGVGGWALDVASEALSWTDETCRIHDLPSGHSPSLDEALGYYTPAARETIKAAVSACLASGQRWDLELPLVTAAGRCIWVRAVGEAEFADGQVVRLLGAFQDVTNRRALEAELRAKNDLVTSIIENLPCGLSVFDRDLRLVTANREFYRLLGLPEELVEADEVHFERIIRYNAERGEYGAGDVDAIVNEYVARARETRTPHQFERMRPNGVPLEVRGSP